MRFDEEMLEGFGQVFVIILLFYKDNIDILEEFGWCWNEAVASPTGIEPVFYA